MNYRVTLGYIGYDRILFRTWIICDRLSMTAVSVCTERRETILKIYLDAKDSSDTEEDEVRNGMCRDDTIQLHTLRGKVSETTMRIRTVDN